MNWRRASNCVLTRRGLGVSSAASGSGKAWSSGMLRPKRAPGLLLVKYMLLASVSSGSLELPIAGLARSL